MDKLLATLLLLHFIGWNVVVSETNQTALSPRIRRSSLNIYGLRCLCACKMIGNVLDLGPDHYPRMLFDGTCQLDSCSTSNSKCDTISYQVSVVYKLNHASTEEPEFPVHWPESLRAEWGMKKVKIHVGCVPKHKASWET